MSAKIKETEKDKKIEGEKISFNSAEDYMAIQLNGPDGKPTGPVYVEHKHLAKRLIGKKAATEAKGSIEVAKSQTQIIED
ncbi:hypothetical protein [Chryseobacterium sp. 2VB]|uniref:hypothetical protein n=1 Tax=Chryseobacterium sp. 2VB TaxID=2502204 RepID=UPI0010F43B88|nr:hypothetical protein [Chryseobacterium sp. 2VB]